MSEKGIESTLWISEFRKPLSRGHRHNAKWPHFSHSLLCFIQSLAGSCRTYSIETKHSSAQLLCSSFFDVVSGCSRVEMTNFQRNFNVTFQMRHRPCKSLRAVSVTSPDETFVLFTDTLTTAVTRFSNQLTSATLTDERETQDTAKNLDIWKL